LDAVWVDRLAEIPIAPAPEFGAARILSRYQIRELVQNAAGPLREIGFTGASAVQVRLQGRQLEFRDVVPVLKAHLLETTPWRDEEIAILSVGNLKGIEVPPGKLDLSVSSKASIAGRHRIMVPIDVVQTGKILRSFWVTADVRIHAEILTAGKKLLSGKIVSAGDVLKTSIEIPDLGADYIRNLDDVLGKAARRNFSPGDPLTREAFTNPLLVKNGETVHLRLERSGIVLTSLARAEQDGRLGQVIRVRSLDFSARLKAQVTGRAEVKIQ
jgi:flagella basal body P-ring formation protein FlgA